MSVSTEQIKGFDSEEDRQLLVSLLSEYAKKLSALCDAIEKYRDRKRMYRLGLIIAFLIAFTTFRLASGAFSPVGVFISMIAFTFAIAPPSYWPSPGVFSSGDRKDERLVRDITLLSKKLEKVVQIVSQLQEHSPENASSRIEMDFRLADAELVLERSISYISSRQKVKNFWEKLRLFA
jgi:hypothetical protein